MNRVHVVRQAAPVTGGVLASLDGEPISNGLLCSDDNVAAFVSDKQAVIVGMDWLGSRGGIKLGKDAAIIRATDFSESPTSRHPSLGGRNARFVQAQWSSSCNAVSLCDEDHMLHSSCLLAVAVVDDTIWTRSGVAVYLFMGSRSGAIVPKLVAFFPLGSNADMMMTSQGQKKRKVYCNDAVRPSCLAWSPIPDNHVGPLVLSVGTSAGTVYNFIVALDKKSDPVASSCIEVLKEERSLSNTPVLITTMTYSILSPSSSAAILLVGTSTGRIQGFTHSLTALQHFEEIDSLRMPDEKRNEGHIIYPVNALVCSPFPIRESHTQALSIASNQSLKSGDIDDCWGVYVAFSRGRRVHVFSLVTDHDCTLMGRGQVYSEVAENDALQTQWLHWCPYVEKLYVLTDFPQCRILAYAITNPKRDADALAPACLAVTRTHSLLDRATTASTADYFIKTAGYMGEGTKFLESTELTDAKASREDLRTSLSTISRPRKNQGTLRGLAMTNDSFLFLTLDDSVPFDIGYDAAEQLLSCGWGVNLSNLQTLPQNIISYASVVLNVTIIYHRYHQKLGRKPSQSAWTTLHMIAGMYRAMKLDDARVSEFLVVVAEKSLEQFNLHVPKTTDASEYLETARPYMYFLRLVMLLNWTNGFMRLHSTNFGIPKSSKAQLPKYDNNRRIIRARWQETTQTVRALLFALYILEQGGSCVNSTTTTKAIALLVTMTVLPDAVKDALSSFQVTDLTESDDDEDEYCDICTAIVPFEDFISGTCLNGHVSARDQRTFESFTPNSAGYWICPCCEASFERPRARDPIARAPSCLLCGVNAVSPL